MSYPPVNVQNTWRSQGLKELSSTSHNSNSPNLIYGCPANLYSRCSSVNFRYHQCLCRHHHHLQQQQGLLVSCCRWQPQVVWQAPRWSHPPSACWSRWSAHTNYNGQVMYHTCRNKTTPNRSRVRKCLIYRNNNKAVNNVR